MMIQQSVPWQTESSGCWMKNRHRTSKILLHFHPRVSLHGGLGAYIISKTPCDDRMVLLLILYPWVRSKLRLRARQITFPILFLPSISFSQLKISSGSGNSKMENRALIIERIPVVMRNFLNAYEASPSIPPIRILGDTPNSILDHGDFVASIKTITEAIKDTIIACRPEAQIRWIAVTKFEGRHSFFVLDLNNSEYVYEYAHMRVKKIPVYILRLSKAPKIFRHEPQDQMLAERLAQMHNLHGTDPLPLFDDHTRPLVYSSPRDLLSWHLYQTSSPDFLPVWRDHDLRIPVWYVEQMVLLGCFSFKNPCLTFLGLKQRV